MLLNRQQVLARLMNGEKLVPVGIYNGTKYCYYTDDKGKSPFRAVLKEGNTGPMVTGEYNHSEWEVYEEPAKEVTMADIEAKFGCKVKVVK